MEKEHGLVNWQGQGGGTKPRLSKEQTQALKIGLQRQSTIYTLGQMRHLVQERASQGQLQQKAGATPSKGVEDILL